MNVWLTEIWRAWRASLRRPGFLLLAVGVLALGIGASVAVFTLIDQALMAPLPVPQPSRLVVLGPSGSDRHVTAVSPQQYQHIGKLDGVQSTGLVQDGPTVNIAGDGEPELVPVMYGDHGLLPTLGLQLALGRNFTTQEDQPHGPAVVILNHGFWQRRFGGDEHVIGRTLQVEGRSHTIIGVLPAAYAALGYEGDLLLPMALPPATRDDGTNYSAVARLAHGADIAAVGAQLDTRMHTMYLTQSGSYADYWQRAHFSAEEFNSWRHDGVRPMLALFLASALFVLLIAVVNLGNLMLLRSLSRSHDAAVRSALGAPGLRLALPALAEGLLVGLLGALLGLGLAVVGLTLLQRYIPTDWMDGASLHFDARAWGMALAIGLLGALLAAALGLWRGRAATTVDELREGGRSGIGLRSSRLGKLLVVIQMALATGLLCAAGLFLHTLYDASRTPLGFSSEGILTFDLAPVKTRYPDAASVRALSDRLVQQLRAAPGIDEAAATTNLPADTWGGQFNLGGLHAPGGKDFNAQFHGVTPSFFPLFDVKLREGRLFTRQDVHGGEPVVIVDQALANRYYGGHALGKQLQRLQRGDGAGMWAPRIVGVVADTYQTGALDGAAEVVYVPLAQMTDSAMIIFRSFEPMRFALHVQGDPYRYRQAAKQAVSAVAPDQPIANLRSMREVVSGTTAPLRLNLLLVGIFATLSLLLAGAGMYAVMAVAVAAREREFGVRLALGAAPMHVLRLVLGGGLVQIGMGLVLGVMLALMLSGVLNAVMEQLDRRSAFDPLAVAGVCVILAFAGLLACVVPALRAARVHPMRALRGE
jgi:putative ABC transport system permease protein